MKMGDADFDWNGDLFDASSDENEAAAESSRLSGMVRRQYLDHLKGSLHHNYGPVMGEGPGCELTGPDLTRLALLLERTALRASMRTNLYQRAMSSMISEVKRASRKGKVWKEVEWVVSKLKSQWQEVGCQTGQIEDSVKSLPSRPLSEVVAKVSPLVASVPPSSTPITQPPQATLEERLSTMSHLFAKEESSKPTRGDGSINWELERAAQYCEFYRVMSRLSENKRSSVRTDFLTLFGEPGEEDSNLSQHTLSSELIAKARRRTANIVVHELNPFYEAKRVASSQVFKALAKKITDTVLMITYAPEKRRLSKVVQHLFLNKQKYNTVEQVSETQIELRLLQ